MDLQLQMLSATPILASLDMQRTMDFYVNRLGFRQVYAEQGVYGIVTHGKVHLHFWACNDPRIPEATACRIAVSEIDVLYSHCLQEGIVHPNAALTEKPWGTREFAILDIDGNCVTFHQSTDLSQPSASDPQPSPNGE